MDWPPDTLEGGRRSQSQSSHSDGHPTNDHDEGLEGNTRARPQDPNTNVITAGDPKRNRKASSPYPYRSLHYDIQRAAPSQWQYWSQPSPLLSPPHPALRKHSASPPYQAHQLVALCFNALAGHYCEHCEQLRRVMNHDHQSAGSPDSHRTLKNRQHDSPDRPSDGGEKGGDNPDPRAPVGFFDSRLNGLRIKVLGLWLRTGEFNVVGI